MNRNIKSDIKSDIRNIATDIKNRLFQENKT